ncbi:flagellar filament capping protein FliD [Oceanisphaera avium]|uniref:Flagellar hook-associated protein 2 n=1 Tax=Oceanisphaera avium TaxID=1903694 RepID=A0A1Y0CWN1_9GAMM|nr:flagellar filament capping protein FliD [Oceanisphaera avium]ART79741.1 flagellar hook-associated protein 2 [Oceanisphaera avium]
MSGLKLPGVGSGFPIQQFVDATVAAERGPKANMLGRQANDIKVQLSSYGSLKSVLDEFKSSLKKLGEEEAFQKRTTSFNNSGFVSAKADKDAVAGSYTLQVNKLATAHKLGSDYVAKEDATKKLGAGTFSFTLGSGENAQSFGVSVSQEKSSLKDIAEAINNAEDNKGVRATVVTGEDGARLVFFADKTGTDSTITVSATSSGTSEVAGKDLQSLVASTTTVQEAQNAELTIDGALVVSQSNEIKNAIQGVTLDLKKINDKPEQTDAKVNTTLTIGYDKGTVEKNLKDFVASFNKVMGTLNQLTSYDQKSQVAGPLNGDSTARNLTSQIKRMLSEPIEGAVSPLRNLTDLGITSKQDGTIELDEDILKKHVEDNFERIGVLFASEEGVSKKLDDMLETFVGKTGILTERDKSLNERMAKLDKEAVNFEMYMEKFEERTYRQFSKMDISVARLNQQLDSVMAAFSSMPDFSGNKK